MIIIYENLKTNLFQVVEKCVLLSYCPFINLMEEQLWKEQRIRSYFVLYVKLTSQREELIYVSHPCPIKHLTLFVKIELNAFSNIGHIYSHFEKKKNQISQKLTK